MVYSIAVFCGSRAGSNPAFAQTARALGQGMARAGIRLVYGGGRVGLMGILADAVLREGGTVLGVIPEFLVKWEVAHDHLSELAVTDDMHGRKRRMAEEADAFIVLPGGIGTLDEAIEIISWRQLRLHAKPVYLCDVAGSAAPLVAAIEATIALGFADAAVRGYFEVMDGVDSVLARVTGEASRAPP